MTMKQVRFVKADSRNPVQEIAELAVFDASGNPVDPPTSGDAEIGNNSVTTEKLADKAVTVAKIDDSVLPANATTEKAGLVKQAAHVGGESVSVQDIVNALVAAGIMASS